MSHGGVTRCVTRRDSERSFRSDYVADATDRTVTLDKRLRKTSARYMSISGSNTDGELGGIRVCGKPDEIGVTRKRVTFDKG